MKLKKRLSDSERLFFPLFQNLYSSFQFHLKLHTSYIHFMNMNVSYTMDHGPSGARAKELKKD